MNKFNIVTAFGVLLISGMSGCATAPQKVSSAPDQNRHIAQVNPTGNDAGNKGDGNKSVSIKSGYIEGIDKSQIDHFEVQTEWNALCIGELDLKSYSPDNNSTVIKKYEFTDKKTTLVSGRPTITINTDPSVLNDSAVHGALLTMDCEPNIGGMLSADYFDSSTVTARISFVAVNKDGTTIQLNGNNMTFKGEGDSHRSIYAMIFK